VELADASEALKGASRALKPTERPAEWAVQPKAARPGLEDPQCNRNEVQGKAPWAELRWESEESNDDCPNQEKEAGGAQDDNREDEDNAGDDEEADNDEALESKSDGKEEAKLALLRREMESLERCRYSKGTVASVFAQAKARRTNQGFATKVMASLASICEGSKNPDPGAVAAALETEAANSWAFLVVMNDDMGFTLLHHLQRLKCKIRPRDPIIDRVVAFEGDIRPQGPTPNVVVFDEAKETMFRRLFLPPVRLPETLCRYSARANGNDQNNTFVVDPAVTERVTGPVTQVIPIPMEWAPRCSSMGPILRQPSAGYLTCLTPLMRTTVLTFIPSQIW
jgi:hypothetical protein